MGSGLGSADWLGLREAYRRALMQGRLDNYRKQRWERREEFARWLTEENLPCLKEKQALALFRGSGGRGTKEFKVNSIEDIRDALDFLLYDTVKLEGRFDECSSPGGAYKLAGAGKEFVSYLLCLRDPSLFAFWGSHSERALRKIGIYLRGLGKGNLGLGYIDLLEALQAVRRQIGLADFQAVDEFTYAVTRPGTQ